jgi:hypothetical protein
MNKRFSIKAFILAVLIHFLVTWSLFMFSEYSYEAWRDAGARADSVWMKVWPRTEWIGWIVQPIAMYARNHSLPWGQSGNDFDRPNPTNYLIPWIFLVGIFFGFLVPRISRWRRNSSNEATAQQP